MQNRIIYGDEVGVLLSALDSRTDKDSRFNRAIVAMAVGCGMEPVELAKLPRSYVFRSDYQVLDRSYIPESVSVSGKKRPLGLLWPVLREILEDYRQFIFDNQIHASSNEMDREQPMFCRPDGSAFSAWSNGTNKTANRQINNLIQGLIDRTPLAGNGVTPKSLRHSFAFALYKHGITNGDEKDEGQLSELTGYSNQMLGQILLRAPCKYYEPLNEIYTIRKRKRKAL